MGLEEKEYNPIGCNHKIKEGKYKGFSSYEFLSGGGSSDFEDNLSVCRLCGEIKANGKKIVDGKWQYYEVEFSIYYPDAVEAIVKNCNFMNKETEGYIPFKQLEL